MPQGNRPDRVGEEIRHELSTLLTREVSDPGIGFITLTRVKVSPDLQMVRVYYTELGDDNAKRETVRALQRAMPFLRRQLGARVRLRRVPELRFEFDQGVEHQARIEKILIELQAERDARGEGAPGEPPGTGNTDAEAGLEAGNAAPTPDADSDPVAAGGPTSRDASEAEDDGPREGSQKRAASKDPEV
jgi:ribosome-binding factor A